MTAPPQRTPGELSAARRLLAAAAGTPEPDRIARLAVRLLGVSAAQVSLLTEIQTVTGDAGLRVLELDGEATPLEPLGTVIATRGKPMVVPDARAEAGLSHHPPVLPAAVGAYLGVPLTSDDGQTVGALCVFETAPRPWSETDVTLLEQLAASAVAELERSAFTEEYRASRMRWELAIEAAGIGSFDWDLVTGQLSWDRTLLAMFGYDEDTFDGTIEAFNARLHPDDLPRVTRAVQDAIAEIGTFELEYRILLPTGGARWVQARGRVVGDATGRAVRLLGAASDTTRQRDGEAGVVRVLESMSAAFIALDRDWRFSYVNAEAERLLGTSRSDLVGGVIWDLFPATVGSDFELRYRRATETGRPEIFEAYYPAPLNAWYEVRASPVPEGLSISFVDVTAARTARELMELSAWAGEQLSSSLDVEDTVTRLARLVVPGLADWSIVSVVEPGGHVRDLACFHVDPAMCAVVERYAATRFDDVELRSSMDQALRSEAPVIIPAGVRTHSLVSLRSPDAIAAITELAPESAVVLPLVANGHVTGAVSLCRGVDRPAMSTSEIEIARLISGRAALALDNARLHAEQRASAEELRRANQRLQVAAEHDRTVARALQDAMLTRLPEPDHLELVATYLTATGTDEVGGDWYDAVLLPTGATTVMIGDVAGHDIAAAAVMGQLRNMLRAFAWDRDEPPSQVVARLDRAIHDLRLGTLATLAMVRLEQPAEDRMTGTRLLRWTNAGHPPPVLIHADGTVIVLERPPELLLGVAPHTLRHDHTEPVPPDSILLLYTDGLIESRDSNLDAGLQRLRDVLAVRHRLPAAEMLDALVADMVGNQPADDVAVLAVRFHAEGGESRNSHNG